MWHDVVDTRDFYGSALGQTARRMIRRKLRDQWPDVSGQSVLGLGYAVPYLGTFRNEALRIAAAMPASQGVLHWPRDEPGQTALVDELELPFDDLAFDRVLLVHALEYAEQVRPLLREIWRVLAGSGRLIVVVPNRRGLWARFERTPFGHGLPYSARQISMTLRDNMFTPLQIDRALFVPPMRGRVVLSTAAAMEKIGRASFKTFGGVIAAEAVKQIYAAPPVTERSRIKRYLPVPGHTSHTSSRR